MEISWTGVKYPAACMTMHKLPGVRWRTGAPLSPMTAAMAGAPPGLLVAGEDARRGANDYRRFFDGSSGMISVIPGLITSLPPSWLKFASLMCEACARLW